MKLIYDMSHKQEQAVRTIQKQCDQLLQMCKETQAELDYLKNNFPNHDTLKQLEIEKTQKLVDSIAQDIKTKKQEMNQLEIKSRYEQLMALYQQTQGEIKQKKETQNTSVLSTPSTLEKENQMRLDLRTTTELQPQAVDQQYENMLKKWQETMEKVKKPTDTPPDDLQVEIPVAEEKKLDISELLPEVPPIPQNLKPKENMTQPEVNADIPPTVVKNKKKPVATDEPKNTQPASDKKGENKGGKYKIGYDLFNVLFYFVITMVILVGALFGLYHSSSGEPRSVLGYSALPVTSGSMHPTLPVNAVIIINRNFDSQHLSEGQVVTFRTESGSILTHRIHTIYQNHQSTGERGFRLIGDASEFPDYDVHLESQFLGRYVVSNEPLGQLLMFIYQSTGFVIFLTLITLSGLFVIKIKLKKTKTVST